jgi:hypothetical protein
MHQPDMELLTNWIEQFRGRVVDVIIAGRYFGGKPGESPQQVEAWGAMEQGFTIHFGGGHDLPITKPDGTTELTRVGGTERLEVIQPSGISIGADGALLVEAADEARFGWHFYDLPQTPGNWCVNTYRRKGEDVEFSVTGPIKDLYCKPLPELFRAPDGPFVCVTALGEQANRYFPALRPPQ